MIFAKLIVHIYEERQGDPNAECFAKEDRESLQESVQELRERIQQRRMSTHFLRAVNVMQRLLQKYLSELPKASPEQQAFQFFYDTVKIL